MQFQIVWRNKFLTITAKSIEDMVASLRGAANRLEAMAGDGIVLSGGQDEDYAHLTTTDPKIAKKWRMEKDPDDPHDHEHGGES